MDEKNWLLGLKEKACDSDLTEADESPIDYDVADDSADDSVDDSADDSVDDFAADSAVDFAADSAVDFVADSVGDFADFDGVGFLPPAAVPKQNSSFKESLKNFSYPRWLKSVLPQYFKPALWMTALFFVMIAVGYAAGHYHPEIFDSLLLFDNLPAGGSFELMLYIFFNNSSVLFMLVFFGFIFSIFPLLVIISNGFMVGIVSEASIRNVGLPFLLTGLLPHGIIEIPLIMLGAGIGFRMGLLFTRLLLNLI